MAAPVAGRNRSADVGDGAARGLGAVKRARLVQGDLGAAHARIVQTGQGQPLREGLDQADVALGGDGAGGGGHVRCAYATALPQLEAALERMARFLDALPATAKTERARA